MYGRRFFSIHRVEALLQFIGTLKVMARFGDKRPPLTPWLSGPVSPSTMQGQRKAFFATSPLSQEDGASLAPWQPSRRREPQTQDRTPRSSKFETAEKVHVLREWMSSMGQAFGLLDRIVKG